MPIIIPTTFRAAPVVQLLGAFCLMIVVFTHVAEAFSLFPRMGWGLPNSPGHYVDFISAIAGLIMFPIGLSTRSFAAERTRHRAPDLGDLSPLWPQRSANRDSRPGNAKPRLLLPVPPRQSPVRAWPGRGCARLHGGIVKTDQAAIAEVLASNGRAGFAAAWLRRKGLEWAAELLEPAPAPETATASPEVVA
jgi:hypothetical protein